MVIALLRNQHLHNDAFSLRPKAWFHVKIILKNFRLEPPPSVVRPKILLFQHVTTSEVK